MQKNGFTLDYLLEPLGLSRDAIVWSAHPQFLAGPDTRVRCGGQGAVVSLGQTYPQCEPSSPLPLSLAHLEPGTAEKYFVTAVSWAEIRHADGSRLGMEWTGISTLGLWLDNRKYARTAVIGLEPTTSPTDSREEASVRGLGMELTCSHSWRVNVEFSRT